MGRNSGGGGRGGSGGGGSSASAAGTSTTSSQVQKEINALIRAQDKAINDIQFGNFNSATRRALQVQVTQLDQQVANLQSQRDRLQQQGR